MEFVQGVLGRARRLVAPSHESALGQPSSAGTVRLSEVERVLACYVYSLWEVRAQISSAEDDIARRRHFLRRGRELRSGSDISTACYTDGFVLYLPVAVEVFPRRDDNFALYRGMSTLCAAQLRNSSLRYVRWFLPSAEKRLALDLFTALENLRLERLVSRDLRGLGQHLDVLRQQCWERRPVVAGVSHTDALFEALLYHLLTGATVCDLPATAQSGKRPRMVSAVCEEMIARAARNPLESAQDSARLALDLSNLLSSLPGPYRGHHRLPYWPQIRPEIVVAATAVAGSPQAIRQGPAPSRQAGNARSASDRTRPTGRQGGGVGMRGDVPNDVSEASGAADHGNSPDKPARRPEVVAEDARRPFRDPQLVEIGRSSTGGDDGMDGWEAKGEIGRDDQVFVYDEWDYRIEGYRHGLCVLTHAVLPVLDDDESALDPAPDGAIMRQIKRQFELLRPHRRWQKRQLDGEEIDLESAIESVVDRHASGLWGERLYLARNERFRDVAAAFLVDLSASTETWVKGLRRVLDVERQALLLMSGALEILGDSYAIYGFSSRVEKGCAFYRIKGFGEGYGDVVKTRIRSLGGRGYTRMGAPIRHVTRILANTDAHLKLLLILSDGKPNEVGIYQGQYAVEDTRQAVLEARERHIFPFGVTIDRCDKSYLTRIFGAKGYAVIDDAVELPQRMAAIYRQLTT